VLHYRDLLVTELFGALLFIEKITKICRNVISLEIIAGLGKHLGGLDILLLNDTRDNVDGILGHYKEVFALLGAALHNTLNEAGKLIAALDKNLIGGLLVNPNEGLFEDGVGIIV